MTDENEPKQQPAVIHWILDHPKLAGFLGAIALAVGFSPKVSGVASWICIVIAIIFGVAMLLGLGEKQQWAKKTRLVGVVGLVAALLLFGFWLTDAKQALHGESTKGFHVEFKTELVDLTRNKDDAMFWIAYPSNGETISPISVMAFLEITNLASDPASISHYSFAIKTEDAGWIYLSPIPSNNQMLLFGYNGLESMSQTSLDGGLDMQWSHLSMQPNVPVFGMLLFDTKIASRLSVGSLVQFKLDLTDSRGQEYSYESAEMSVKQSPSPGSSFGATRTASLFMLPFSANAEKANRRFYSDPVPQQVQGQPGVIVLTPKNGSGTIVLEDGVFLASTRLRPAS